MSLPLPFRNLFHLGYVVLDLEKVMDDMRERLGISKWKVLPLPRGAPANGPAR